MQEEFYHISVKPNRNTTLQSLTALCLLLITQNKKDFTFYYKIATHDDNGASIWNLMNTSYMTKEEAEEIQAERERTQLKVYGKVISKKPLCRKYYNNGVIQVHTYICPDGFVPGKLPNEKLQALAKNQKRDALGHFIKEREKEDVDG